MCLQYSVAGGPNSASNDTGTSGPDGLLGGLLGGGSPQEDCLLLNMMTPAFPKSGKLPVAVYIHGGAYLTGSASVANFKPLVSFGRGQFIIVAIQYRLGAQGFMAGTEIQKDGTANAGLLDQRSALEWVQRNIAAFGGDRTKVTMW